MEAGIFIFMDKIIKHFVKANSPAVLLRGVFCAIISALKCMLENRRGQMRVLQSQTLSACLQSVARRQK